MTIEHLITIGGFVLALGTFWNAMSAKIAAQEKRMTLIESENRYNRQQIDSNISRLNDHEKQQQTMIALVQKVNNITEDLTEVKADLKQLLRNGGN